MDREHLKHQIEAFTQWKADLEAQIRAYQSWLDEYELNTPDSDLRIMELLEALASDRITIAFVAQVSSGKTELINAIFFSTFKRRLLPSAAGRTTMCPTELFHDAEHERPYIRLLPIETRLREASIAEFKRSQYEWVTIPLDVTSPDSMAEAFEEVTRVKHVPVDEAKRLGLFDEWHQKKAREANGAATYVEVPMWRHALISFPHPLLQQGLVVLDTPGLNALGTEPELTLNMLPNAHSVLFLLAADTGVTKSDLDMWEHHVRAYRAASHKALIVVLNKIDTLWDELKDPEAVMTSMHDQCYKAAEMLHVPTENVFPTSAQKALLGRVRDDEALVAKSGILQLERTLAEGIMPEKHRIIRDNIVTEVSEMAVTTRDIVRARLNAADKQRKELTALSGKNADVISHLLATTREEQISYNAHVESLHASRRALSQQASTLLDHLNPDALDDLIKKTREQMSGSWTTRGLKGAMKVFFESVRDSMDSAGREAAKAHKLAQAIYQKFHEDHGMADLKPKLFTTAKYRGELEQLYVEAEIFRNSPMTTMTEQNQVIKKFFITLVSRTRGVVGRAHRDGDRWARTVMSPLISQIKEHKRQIQRRLETLRKVNESRDTLEEKLQELDRHCDELSVQVANLDAIVNNLSRPLIVDAAERAA